MKAKLTEKDIKKLKYELRSGLVFALMLFFLSGLISFLFILDKEFDTAVYIISLSLVLSGIIYYSVNQKIISDLSNKKKYLKLKPLKRKHLDPIGKQEAVCLPVL